MTPETSKRKKGSGRTRGAGSFVYVTMAELNSRFKDDQPILVNRRFAELNGLKHVRVAIDTMLIKDLSLPPVEVRKIEL